MNTKILLVILLLQCLQFCDGFKIQNGNDDEFQSYLDKAMANYTTWLKENNLDPSPLITETFILDADSFRKAYLVCEISNQFVSGHSDTTDAENLSDSDFASHMFGIGRDVHQSYIFQGSFSCTGAIKALYHDELNGKDLPFGGQGNFAVRTTDITEILLIQNVGITEEYKFDLSHSSTLSQFIKILETTDIIGHWNESVINTMYLGDIVETFEIVYDVSRFFQSNGLRNPAIQLLYEYLRKIMQEVELETILPPGNLPSTYSPTPTVSTTPFTTPGRMTTTNPVTTTNPGTSTNPVTTDTPITTSDPTGNPTVSTDGPTSALPISSTPNYGIRTKTTPEFIFVQLLLIYSLTILV